MARKRKKPEKTEGNKSQGFLARLARASSLALLTTIPPALGLTVRQAQALIGIGWTMLPTYPLMAAIQEISARVGRVTGHGIAGNVCRIFPRP